MHTLKSRSNIGLVTTILAFVFLGLIVIYDVSINESLSLFGDKFWIVRQQFFRGLIGLAFMWLAYKIPLKYWQKIGIPIFVFSLICLLLVLVPGIALRISGAKRWLSFGPVLFQPSELAKLGLIFYLSAWLKKPRRFSSFAVIIGGLFALVMGEPDLGSALVLICIALAMYVASGKPWKHLLWFLTLGFMAIGMLILISPYRLSRLTTYLDPSSDPQGKSYHIRQITLALGNGGLFGQGIGKSRQKYQYIPEAMTDSIFAIVAEEVGLVGCGMIIIGYIYLYTQMMARVSGQKDLQQMLLGVGIAAWVGSQTLVNLGSVVALIPLTGVPLPFISYGGSSLVIMLMSLGVFLQI